MKIIISIFLLLSVFQVVGQTDIETMQETARNFLRQKDYSNAQLVLKKAAQLHPENLGILKDLAYVYYLNGNYETSKNVISPLVDREDADVQTYQIAANIYKELNDIKTIDKLYQKGLKKFPKSGALHFEYGEILLVKEQQAEAIKIWEEGIKLDPSYSGNYYHASKYYYYSQKNIVWCLLYSEIFINLESYSMRTAEIKNQLLDAYKRFYVEQQLIPDTKIVHPFETAVFNLLTKQSDATVSGITPSSLTTIRSKFIENWFNNTEPNFPYRLFDHWQQLLSGGMFDAYNQWLFAGISNPSQFQEWQSKHVEEFKNFQYFQKNRLFKMNLDQYYH
ncbi:MAG: tetratricopeptide repeat protein [Chitinophagaceae bacterium]|nr:tetratricopeptide repeat protein [Chitinophagaceae bacterium]